MASQNDDKYDERLLVRYLLGALSREETERLDELSIVDEEFVARLNAAEDDLVDAYVRKELSGADAEKFQSSYLASSRRRQKVEFAETLNLFKPRVPAPEPEKAPIVVPETPVAPPAEGEKRSSRNWGWWPRLAFAGTALVLLLAVAYLLRQNLGLRNEMNAARAQQDSLRQRQQQLEQELARQQSANSDAQKQLDQAHAQPNLSQLKMASLILPPPMRGAARVPTLSVRSGTDLAVVLLTLEADDFPSYKAALKNPADGKVLWQSDSLESSSAGERKAVSISFPAGLLKQQNYFVELAGVSAKGKQETIASYPFRVVLK